ncbi:hypothetical protein [Georgenia subflava]|uniref:Uncharacterized protein n=1 Tax=Georgenia subflava TaxID=1622177 RepID=A0A6N7EGY7_9MICO|nr:hypothetical protein [Georgenia subflava]MPV35925.1 hypothetical protein [Georgenia subflava]
MIRHDATGRKTSVPVVLPLVEATIEDSGHITVVVDGEAYLPRTPLSRANLRAQIAALAADRATPLRVHVREPGGGTFTDVVTPEDAALLSAPTAPAPAPESPSATSTGAEAEPFQVTGEGPVVGLTGSGFLPGEHVAFAVIVLRQQADADGTAVLHLPGSLTNRKPGPFVLFGQTSGTLVLADPFGGDQR